MDPQLIFIRFLIMKELFVTLFNLFHMKEQFWYCALPHSSILRCQMQKKIIIFQWQDCIASCYPNSTGSNMKNISRVAVLYRFRNVNMRHAM